MVREEKTKRWKEYIEELDQTTSDSQVWRTIRCIDGRNPPQVKNETLKVDGVAYVSDQDKAKQFAKTYKSFSKLPVCREDRKICRQVSKAMDRKSPCTEEVE